MNLLENLFRHITSPLTPPPLDRERVYSNYLEFVLDEKIHTPESLYREVFELCEGDRLDSEVRKDISFALAMKAREHLSVFEELKEQVYLLAAKHLFPSESAIGGDLPYNEMFAFGQIAFEEAEMASAISDQLRRSIFSLDLRRIPTKCFTLLLLYCTTNRYGPGSPALTAEDSLLLVKHLLKVQTDPRRMKSLSAALTSPVGNWLYHELFTGELREDYARFIVDWYFEHAKSDWTFTSFLPQMGIDYPYLLVRVDKIMNQIGRDNFEPTEGPYLRELPSLEIENLSGAK